MASLTETSITYADLQKNIDETSLSNILNDITGIETAEERATDFISSTFVEILAISLKVDFDLSDYDDYTGSITKVLKKAFLYLSLGTILNSTEKKLGWDKKTKGMKLLEALWGKGIYSEKGEQDSDTFFECIEQEYIPTGKMEELYDNDLFS